MANQALPSINDIEPSWADISATFCVDGGQALNTIDFAAIKTSRKGEVGERKGPGGRTMARTSGDAKNEASVVLYRSSLRRLIRALMAKAPTRGNQVIIGLVTFDILICHTPPGETEIYKRKIKGCRYMGESIDDKEGNDADKIEVSLSVAEIVDIIDDKEVVLV